MTTLAPNIGHELSDGLDADEHGTRLLPRCEIMPSPENELLYRPVSGDDPEIVHLAESIREHGVLQPLDVTSDGYIISGHRRYAASRLAGVSWLPCIVHPITREDDPDAYLMLLREYNRQREKSNDERLREEILDIDPEEAHRVIVEHRRRAAAVDVDTIKLKATKRKRQVSPRAQQFLAGVQGVLEKLKDFLPISERTIHYHLLNRPPLKDSSNPDSKYRNTRSDNNSLSKLITSARIEGSIPFEAIVDETRPRVNWEVHPNTREFLKEELDKFLKGYYRDLLISQPNFIHIHVEKMTLLGTVKPVASDYTVPVTCGRGTTSHPPLWEIATKFEKSGKSKLILLVISDFDPAGIRIAESFCRNLRDDYRIGNIVPIRVGITPEQIERYDLPVSMEAKSSDVNYRDFVREYGRNAHEVESMPPGILQQELREAIDSVLDVDAFNAEVDREEEDAAWLECVRRRALKHIENIAP